MRGARSFQELLCATLEKYHNRLIDASAVIREIIDEAMSGGEAPMLQRVNDALLELERQTGVAAPHKRSITA